MAEARVMITKITDIGTYPLWAEAELTDRFGEKHVFRDKLPIFAYDDTDTACPREGAVRCFIKEENDTCYIIDTAHPDDIEDENGKTVFEVYKEDISPRLEKSKGMTAVTDDTFEKIYKGYDDSVIEYYLMKSSMPYDGEKSHRNAALFTMEEINAVCKADNEPSYSYAPDMMRGRICPAKEVFAVNGSPKDSRYYHAFIEPPCGSHYTAGDFRYINSLLFPKGVRETEIYEWSSDWSGFFEDGNEWWGCLYYTVYDKAMERYVVIAASATD